MNVLVRFLLYMRMFKRKAERCWRTQRVNPILCMVQLNIDIELNQTEKITFE